MKKRLFIFVASLPFYALAQPSLDSLQRLLDSPLSQNERIDVLNELAYNMRYSKREESLNRAKEALELSKETGNKRGEGLANVTIGSYFVSRPNYAKSIEYSLAGLRLLDEANDKTGLMRVFILLGVTYRQLGEISKAQDYLNQGLSLSKELNNATESARICNSLGLIAFNQGDNDKAEKFFLESLEYAKKSKMAHLNTLANMGALYTKTGNVNKALQYLDEGLLIAEKTNSISGKGNIYTKLGCLYASTGDLTKAIRHLRQAEVFSIQGGELPYLLDGYECLINAYLQQGSIKEAFEYQVKMSNLRDSLFNKEKAQQITNLTAQHETEKRDQTIKQLEREQELQSIIIITVVGGTAIFAAAMVLIFLLQRSRARKTRRLLEMQHVLNEKLREVDKIKSIYFANLSHEFRTPLTLILAPIEIELKKKLVTDGSESLAVVQRNALRLLELVNQLLDLTKIESGKMKLHITASDMNELFKQIVESFRPIAEQKAISFSVQQRIPTGIYWFDPDAVEKMITNLLANAFKYTPTSGSVAVEATLDIDHIVVNVADTGIGIPADEQEHVFTSYFQSTQTRGQGTGLGLSLVKELVNLHKGEITFTSFAGRGSTFSIKFPITREAFDPEQILLPLEHENNFVSPMI